MPKEQHSDKARETLRLMNSAPERWHIAEIEWKKELRFVPTKVKCPACEGKGRAFVRRSNSELVSGIYRASPFIKAFLIARGDRRAEMKYFSYTEGDKRAWMEAEGIAETACPTCPARRKFGGQYGTGEVVRPVERLVLVGYIKWTPGTRFNSRFGYGAARSAHQCALCAKGINKSGRVPVQGTAFDGTPLGMFVGEDCARKFLSVEAFKKDEFLNDNLDDAAETPAA